MAELFGKVYNLTFEDYPGVAIKARSVSLGVMTDLEDRLRSLRDLDVTDVEAAHKAAAWAWEPFLDAIIEWNFEVRQGEDLVPVPVSYDGYRMLPDPSLFLRAYAAWRDAQLTVPDQSPLPQPSTVGAPSVEGSIPMVPR